MEWWPMYNDQPELKDGSRAMAGLSANDNRASATGEVAWADEGAHERKRWDEKYVGANRAGSNPIAWVETKSGLTSDVRDRLLAQKEAHISQAPPPPRPGGHKSSFDKLVREATADAAAKAAQPVAPPRQPAVNGDDRAWDRLLKTTAAVQRGQTLGSVQQDVFLAEYESRMALDALQDFAAAGGVSGNVLPTLATLPRMQEKRPKDWGPRPSPQQHPNATVPPKKPQYVYSPPTSASKSRIASRLVAATTPVPMRMEGAAPSPPPAAPAAPRPAAPAGPAAGPAAGLPSDGSNVPNRAASRAAVAPSRAPKQPTPPPPKAANKDPQLSKECAPVPPVDLRADECRSAPHARRPL